MLPEADQLDGYHDGEPCWLPLVPQNAQEGYCLAQQFPRVRL